MAGDEMVTISGNSVLEVLIKKGSKQPVQQSDGPQDMTLVPQPMCNSDRGESRQYH